MERNARGETGNVSPTSSFGPRSAPCSPSPDLPIVHQIRFDGARSRAGRDADASPGDAHAHSELGLQADGTVGTGTLDLLGRFPAALNAVRPSGSPGLVQFLHWKLRDSEPTRRTLACRQLRRLRADHRTEKDLPSESLT